MHHISYTRGHRGPSQEILDGDVTNSLLGGEEFRRGDVEPEIRGSLYGNVRGLWSVYWYGGGGTPKVSSVPPIIPLRRLWEEGDIILFTDFIQIYYKYYLTRF